MIDRVPDEPDAALAEMLMRERSNRRRDRVMMISLIELLTIVVFVAMSVALVTQNKADLSHSYEARLRATERALVEMTRARDQAVAERDRLQRLLNWFVRRNNLPQLQNRPDEIEEWQEQEDERNPMVLSGLPPSCRTAARFLAEVHLFRDGTLQGRPFEGADSVETLAVPGMREIMSTALTPQQFMPQARRAFAHADAQAEKCRYRVRVVTHPDPAYLQSTYATQLDALSPFYYDRVRGNPQP